MENKTIYFQDWKCTPLKFPSSSPIGPVVGARVPLLINDVRTRTISTTKFAITVYSLSQNDNRRYEFPSNRVKNVQTDLHRNLFLRLMLLLSSELTTRRVDR